MPVSRIVFKNNAIRKLMTSPEAVADVAARAAAIAEASGEGYTAEPMQAPRNRAHAIVTASTAQAKRDNEKNNTLVRNLDAGR